MERTYIMLKPDAVRRGLMGEIINKIERKGYKIVAMRMFEMTAEQLRVHYAHIVDRPFYPEVEEYMMSGPVLGMIVEGENVIKGMRNFMGPTKYLDAPAGTIRGDYSCNDRENLIHGSDSPETAEAEIKRFFGIQKPKEQ
ncbi:MAG: nucleoside-diphosphate kinase [Clostridia bacterium]|nr:nucleoside-diphosphate kinase [Clostridia bacterium]